jgi:hypothetical protein
VVKLTNINVPASKVILPIFHAEAQIGACGAVSYGAIRHPSSLRLFQSCRKSYGASSSLSLLSSEHGKQPMVLGILVAAADGRSKERPAFIGT